MLKYIAKVKVETFDTWHGVKIPKIIGLLVYNTHPSSRMAGV
jgi:hypothetical protein